MKVSGRNVGDSLGTQTRNSLTGGHLVQRVALLETIQSSLALVVGHAGHHLTATLCHHVHDGTHPLEQKTPSKFSDCCCSSTLTATLCLVNLEQETDIASKHRQLSHLSRYQQHWKLLDMKKLGFWVRSQCTGSLEAAQHQDRCCFQRV